VGHSGISQTYAQALQTQNLQHAITQNQSRIHLKGLIGSALSFVISNVFKDAQKPFLLVFNDKEEAAHYLNDLEQLLSEKDVLFYPGSYRRPYDIEETDNANVLLRAEVLNRINSQKKPAIIVTYPDALFEQVVTRKELERNTLKIGINDKVSIDFVNEVLFEYKFKRVDFVTEPGEFSVRGGIVDVFSFSHDKPYRIEFFGDEVDSIRTFDVETQLSIEQIKKINIIPNVANKMVEEKRQSFLKYIAQKTVIGLKNTDLLFSRIDDFYAKAEASFKTLSEDIKHAKPHELFCNSELLKKQLLDFSIVEFGVSAYFGYAQQSTPSNQAENNNNAQVIERSRNHQIVYNTTPQPAFNKQFNLLIEDLNTNHDKDYTIYIACVREQQA
jgi:transcription-repair coupling factor (superfamily II helicase)